MDLFSWLDQIMAAIAGLVTDSPWTYVLIGALAALDVVLPILPAEATVLVAAVLAGAGKLDIRLVIAAAAVGAFVGDNIGYAIGRAAGRPLIVRVLRGHTERVEWAERQIVERGGSLIIVGRFVPGGRSAITIGSGMLRMPWLRFAAFDAVAAVVWALQAAVPGYLGGAAFQDRPWLGLVIGALLSVALVVVIEGWRWWRGRRRASEQGAGARASAGEPDAAPVPAEGGAPEEDRVARTLDRLAERRRRR